MNINLDFVHTDWLDVVLHYGRFYLFIYFYFEQYLFKGAQFSEAGFNGALERFICDLQMM